MIYRSDDSLFEIKDVLRVALAVVIVIYILWEGLFTALNYEMAINLFKIDDVRITIAGAFFFTSIPLKLYGMIVGIFTCKTPSNANLDTWTTLQIITRLYNLIGSCYFLTLIIGTLVSLPLVGISIGPVAYSAIVLLTCFVRRDEKWVRVLQKDLDVKGD
eukprot:TRINITY_DN289_c0_g1_i11.p1 TRINITY_DN289_c0_g1~~TRINITY_DN289_c0_g1_i11.p1  ORF type:complete len:160 (+),score=19.75 TRINITY_DN289_c0_g1_i11:205-684(+)